MSDQPILIDTNVFIDHSDVLAHHENIILPIVVLKELDGLKFKPEIGYAARAAIHGIRSYIKSGKKHIFDTAYDSTINNDTNIIFSAKRHNAKILTKDVAMSLLAASFAVDCDLIDDVNVAEYESVIFDSDPEFPFPDNDLGGEDLKQFKKYIQNKFDRELEPWTYYVINKKDAFCYDPKQKKLVYITGQQRYNKFEIEEGVKFKAKDIYQKMAVYSIVNADASLLLGRYGTGKSILSTAVALSLSQDRKVFVLRPTLKKNTYDIGFLPGDKQEKLYEFFSGYMSALTALYGNTRSCNDGKGCGYDYVKEDLSKSKLEFLTMPELHGLSVQAGDIILVDEVQLLNREYMQLLLSRIGEGAKLVMMGDLKQTYSLLKKAESGLLGLLENLPHPGLSVVELRNIYRNKELAELADKII